MVRMLRRPRAAENPEVNVGTGSLDRERFGAVVDAFIESLAAAGTSTGPLDVRENVRFRGSAARSLDAQADTHDRGVVLALEFKKVFMDEWTGEVDRRRTDELAHALASTIPSVEKSLRRGEAMTPDAVRGATRRLPARRPRAAVGPETDAIETAGSHPPISPPTTRWPPWREACGSSSR